MIELSALLPVAHNQLVTKTVLCPLFVSQPASPSLSLDILRYQQSLNGGGSMSALPGVTTNSGPSWGQLAGVAVGTLIGGFVLGALAMWAANRVYKSRCAQQIQAEHAVYFF